MNSTEIKERKAWVKERGKAILPYRAYVFGVVGFASIMGNENAGDWGGSIEYRVIRNWYNGY